MISDPMLRQEIQLFTGFYPFRQHLEFQVASHGRLEAAGN